MKLYLIKHNEKFCLCYEENEENAKKIFLKCIDDDQQYFSPEKNEKLKQRLITTPLEEKNYELKNSLKNSYEITLKNFESYPFVITSDNCIEPIEKIHPPKIRNENDEQSENPAREKMREFLEGLVQNKSVAR